MPTVVVVAMTIDLDDPNEAAEFVRTELGAKLATGAHPWQSEQPGILPRWQISSVRRTPATTGQWVPGMVTAQVDTP